MASKSETKVVPQGIKLSDLAKEFGVTSKVLIEKAKTLNIEVKNYASLLTRGQADRIRAKLGGGAGLRDELAKKKTVVKKGAKPAGRAAKAGTEEPAEAEASEHEIAPEAAEEAAPYAALEPAPEVEAAPPEEPPPVEPAPVEPEPVAEPEPEPVETTAPAPETASAQPAPPARFIAAGPNIAPPIRKETLASTDPRFGVVISADEAKKIHGETPTRGKAVKGAKPVQVESKAVEDFKAQVSYPTLPEVAFEEEESKGGGVRRGTAGPAVRRRGPVGRMPPRKGMPGGQRRGRGLLRDDEGYRKLHRKGARPAAQPLVVRTGPAEVTSPVTIKSLCEALSIKATDLIKKFLNEGKMVKINDILNDEEAQLYASEFDPLKFGITIKKARDVEEEMFTRAAVPDKAEDLLHRAPIVTIMGHVDHGKTSLLDSIRKANVAAGEAGGITQHIGAYRVHKAKGEIVFLDTPGHKAFTEMRARGANVTDMVVLVVAANDGVMPQTEEAISHARAASKPIVVALNKCDLPDANPDKVKGQLAAKEVFVEGYGGSVTCVGVSAKTGKGVDELLERILLEAEVLELKANPEKAAVGTVIESHKDQGRGIVATMLVQEGTLRAGDVVICGHTYGSVRQLADDHGLPVEEAGPSFPVVITGLNDVPLAGERFHVLDSIKEAAEIAEKRAMLLRQEGLSVRQHVTLENLHDMLAQGQVAALRVILKVDVMGSLRPLEQAVSELATTEARVEVLHSGVGAINETDVHLADASDAIIIGFGVTADPGARRVAEERGVELRIYKIIYEVVDEMRKALEGMLKPIEQEVVQGHLIIRQTFKISKVGTVAGCMVSDGVINRNSKVRLVRDGKPVWTGTLASLKRVKDDVREVRAGFECGLKMDGYDDLKEGDGIEAYTVEKVARTLDSATSR